MDLFALILYIPVNDFSIISGWTFPSWTGAKQNKMSYLRTQGTAPVEVQTCNRTLVKSLNENLIFFISQPTHMLWVHARIQEFLSGGVQVSLT